MPEHGRSRLDRGTELREADDSEVCELRTQERDLAVLLAEGDVEQIAEMQEPSSGAVLV